MAAAKSRFKSFMDWARSEFEPTTQLPWKTATVRLHEEIVEFLHGFAIGAILGFLAGFVLFTTIL